jgi:hypothetical protein
MIADSLKKVRKCHALASAPLCDWLSSRPIEIHMVTFAREWLLTNGWKCIWISIQRHYEEGDILVCAKRGRVPDKEVAVHTIKCPKTKINMFPVHFYFSEFD